MIASLSTNFGSLEKGTVDEGIIRDVFTMPVEPLA
jgi:hypothetical protein